VQADMVAVVMFSDRVTSAYSRPSVSDECSKSSEPRNEQAGVSGHPLCNKEKIPAFTLSPERCSGCPSDAVW